MKMMDVATQFPPQTYSSSFFLNSLDEVDDSKSPKIHNKQQTNSSNLLNCFITKMLRKLQPIVPTLLILCHISLFSTVETIECSNGIDKTQTFSSLVDFQTNKRGFNPQESNFQGNSVRFNPQTIPSLPKNSFITFESESVWKLSLDNHQIVSISDGAFLSLKCLHILELYNNDIQSIQKDIFGDLWHLKELNLGKNQIQDIPERVFSFLPLLQTLNLTQNHLTVLHPDSFYKLTQLSTLDLSYNYLNKFSPDSFQYFQLLTNLQLGSNLIECLDAQNWTRLKSLVTLNASNNALDSFDLSYDFSFNSTLRKLYLNQNYLTEFNSIVLIRMLPALKFIDIGENPWLCSDLRQICNNLNNSNVNYVGGSNSEPNVLGISCNRSLDVYKRNKVKPRELPKTPQVQVPPVKETNLSATYVVGSDVLTSVNNMYTFIICFFTLFLLYVICDVVVRTGYINNVINRRRRSRLLSNEDADSMSILGERL